MLTEERHRFIIQTLQQKESINIHHIMAETAASESTVRRDLSLLEKQGKLKRVFGGAVLPDGKQREKENTEEPPDKLGLAAAQLVERGSRLFLDADSRIGGMLPFLTDQNLIVVTNSLLYAKQLSGDGVKVYMLGGPVSDKGTVSGYEAMEYLKKLQFDVCVLGVDGMTREGSVGTDDPEQTAFKGLAASRSQHILVLLDAETARRKAFVGMPELQDAYIVTDMDEQEANGIISSRHLISFAKK